MKIKSLFVFIGFLCIIPTYGRLIQKNKTRNPAEVKTEKPNPAIRLTRDIVDSLSGLSPSDTIKNEEFIGSHVKRSKHFYLKVKQGTPTTVALKKTRTIRESKEVMKADPTQPEEYSNKTAKDEAKRVLVKQPIPKYNDNLENEDFQSEISKSYIISDTTDNEDEDFNVADYDFDVNHDEYITKVRNHAEPRINTKSVNTYDTKISKKYSEIIKNKDKLQTTSIKKERAADLNSYESTTTKRREYDDDDDDDEEDMSTKKPVIKDSTKKAQNEDYSDENDESNEQDRKNSSTRLARSWKVNLFLDKNNKKLLRTISRELKALPLFPQIPYNLLDDDTLV